MGANVHPNPVHWSNRTEESYGTGPEWSRHRPAGRVKHLEKILLENTNMVDRSKKHFVVLQRAVLKCQIPAGSINLKPQVQCKEHPELQAKWSAVKLKSELRFIEVLTKHLEKHAPCTINHTHEHMHTQHALFPTRACYMYTCKAKQWV